MDFVFDEETGTLIINEGVKVLRDEVPFKEKLRKVVLPKSLAVISKGYFENCKELEEVQFLEDSTLRAVEYCAFKGCNSLWEIKFPKSLVFIGTETFKNCTGLEKVEFDLNCRLEIIEEEAFSNSGLREIQLPKGLSWIKESAFRCCYELEKVTWPTVPVTVWVKAFEMSGLRALEGVKFSGIAPNAFCLSRLEKIDITLGGRNSCVIGLESFGKCENLKSVILRAEVSTVIRPNAFMFDSINEIQLLDKIVLVYDLSTILRVKRFVISKELRATDGLNYGFLPDCIEVQGLGVLDKEIVKALLEIDGEADRFYDDNSFNAIQFSAVFQSLEDKLYEYYPEQMTVRQGILREEMPEMGLF